MSPVSLAAAVPAGRRLAPVGTPMLWALTMPPSSWCSSSTSCITREPHEVSMKEAVGWSAFYIALPLGFGVWIGRPTAATGAWSLTGYLVEKSLSVDNLFVFMLLLARVRGPQGAPAAGAALAASSAPSVLRGIFIALGAS